MVGNLGGVQTLHLHNLLGFGYVELHTVLTQGQSGKRLVVG
jgi:hypothetical protein